MAVHFALIVFLSFLNSIAFCQIIAKGKLLETINKSPIAYANIGILNTSVGTITNADGSFEIHIPKNHSNDTLLFSALGFEQKSISTNWFSDKNEVIIYLKERPTLLKNITITSKKIKPVRSARLGNKYYNEGSIYADSSAAGSAMALLIENKFPVYQPDLSLPYYISKVRLRIAHNTFDNFKIRVRILSLDSITGLPDKDLIENNIIATSSIRKGWLDVDLSKFNIRINVPQFFLVFEWILDDEDRFILLEQYKAFKKQFPTRVTQDTIVVAGEKITFTSWHGFRAGTSFGSSSNQFSLDHFKSYYRKNSYGSWRRSSFVLTASVTVSNYNYSLQGL